MNIAHWTQFDAKQINGRNSVPYGGKVKWQDFHAIQMSFFSCLSYENDFNLFCQLLPSRIDRLYSQY